MKALVLAAGSGTRLRPFTHTSAKVLVPVANQPLLFHGLRAVAAAGIVETGIVVGAGADAVRSAVGNGARFGLDVTYLRQEAPLGVAHAMLVARAFLGDDDFALYLGDTYLSAGITSLVDRFRATRPAAQLMFSRVADPTPFGVAELGADGRVVRIEEKPRRPSSDLACVGAYVFTPVVHDALARLRPSPRGELELADAIQRLIDGGRRVDHIVLSGFWRDTGRIEDVLAVNRLALESLEPRVEGHVDADSTLTGPVTVDQGAGIHGSRIEGPAVIGPGALVVGSQIGPYTSIAADCRVVASGVADSVLLRGASLDGVPRLETSLIGREAQVSGAGAAGSRAHRDTHRDACRLVLGDHSTVRFGG